MRNFQRGGTAVIIVMALLAIPAPSTSATSSADVERRIREVRSSLEEVGRDLNAAERDLSFADAQIAEHRKALAEARREGRILRDAISSRAAELYRAGDTGPLQLLVAGTSLNEALDRISYLEQLRRGQTEMLEQIDALRMRAAERSAALTEARQRAAGLRDQLASRRQALESRLTELRRLQNFLQAVSGRRVTSGSSGFRCPVIGASYISNNFGDPRPGGPHTGIDIPAPYGRPVVAIGPGTIVSTPYGGWIGIGIVLRDLAGNEWLYAHLGSRSVRVGQKVLGGEVIGRVGCTGRCYGSHLHFEYHPGGGTPRDPYSIIRSAC